MSSDNLPGYPGSHPHSDRTNWRPGDDDAEELLLQKIRDALREGKSERHIAKLLGVPRMMLWRGKMMAAIPPGLYERLMAARVGTKAMLHIGRFCSDPDNPPGAEVECCPNCGHVLRVRNKNILRAFNVLERWQADGCPAASKTDDPEAAR
jgi:hypothetical protein